ncbi:hypothetical protein F8M41_023262 [Gigaspora margarita]|uniref:Uncharacterized protein n=1 Tax=Gigaspora margarita TaxID=4874 RepID=A0A8H4ADM2_GIGMA|nr:hypothetical protein F8M41_023262 [Gigaspora margarita]
MNEDWTLFLPRSQSVHEDAKLPEDNKVQNCSDKDLTWDEILKEINEFGDEKYIRRFLRHMISKIEEHDPKFFTNYLKNDQFGINEDDIGLWLIFSESEEFNEGKYDKLYYDKDRGFIEFKEVDEKYSKLKIDSLDLDYKKIDNESERSIIIFRVIYEAGIIDKEDFVELMDLDEYQIEKQKIEMHKKKRRTKARNISTIYSIVEKHIDEAQYQQKIEGINLEMLEEKKKLNYEEWNEKLINLSQPNGVLLRFKLKKSNLALLHKYFFRDEYILNHSPLNDETELIIFKYGARIYCLSKSLPAYKQGLPDCLKVISIFEGIYL